jgi:hypothetical protein
VTKEELINFLRENLRIELDLDSEDESCLGVNVALYIGETEISTDHDKLRLELKYR